MTVKGVLWHSTGANNPNLKRYVQPYETDSNYDALIALLGKNNNRNDWNHATVQAGLNCWIGKLADGSVTTVQTMPWDYRPWGCSSGAKGSCNDGWIQFEICEDGLTDASYFKAVYQEACEITAYLCKLYGIDPHGTVKHCGIEVPTILCHKDSYTYGLGSGHADVLHWFPKFGKTMADARDDVAALLTESEEDEDMTQDQWDAMMLEHRRALQSAPASSWSTDAMQWAIDNGLIQGNDSGNTMPLDLLTREQMAVILQRFAQMMGKA